MIYISPSSRKAINSLESDNFINQDQQIVVQQKIMELINLFHIENIDLSKTTKEEMSEETIIVQNQRLTDLIANLFTKKQTKVITQKSIIGYKYLITDGDYKIIILTDLHNIINKLHITNTSNQSNQCKISVSEGQVGHFYIKLNNIKIEPPISYISKTQYNDIIKIVDNYLKILYCALKKPQ